MSKATYEPVVNNQKVRQAFNEELPKTSVAEKPLWAIFF